LSDGLLDVFIAVSDLSDAVERPDVGRAGPDGTLETPTRSIDEALLRNCRGMHRPKPDPGRPGRALWLRASA
jgi:hypothetical protein